MPPLSDWSAVVYYCDSATAFDKNFAFHPSLRQRWPVENHCEAIKRFEVALSMFDTARAIVDCSLPEGLSREERRYAIAKRIYSDELPEAALRAHARHEP